MKKIIGGLIFFLFVTGPVVAGVVHQVQNVNGEYAVSIDDGAQEIIDEIIRVLGLKANFEVKAANIPNAAAVAYNGKRYILYNPQFFNELNEAAGNNWASVSVLAHEIGHHLNGHTIENIGSQPDNELEADEFSGFVLRRMGATVEQAQSAMKVAANYKPSLTHPGKEDRMIAIAEGWNNADAQIAGRADVAKINPKQAGPATSRNTTIYQGVLADQYILGDVSFHADNTASYFVTKRMNLVKLQNNQIYLVGKVSPLENASFPFMIYDENKTLLLVDTQGNIFSRSGAAVGVMKAHRS
jgi:hypothetical protein